MTAYIKNVNGTPDGNPVNLGQGWRQQVEPDPAIAEAEARFRETAEAEKREAGYLPVVQVIVPAHDEATHTPDVIENATHVLNDAGDGWITTLAIREKTTAERNAYLLNAIRQIEASDGYARALRDAPVDETAAVNLAAFRDQIAALRAQLA